MATTPITASTVLWQLLSRSGIEIEPKNTKPAEKPRLPLYRLKRRLRFNTLVSDVLDAEPWEQEGYDPVEEEARERADAVQSLNAYLNKPHMLMMLPSAAIKRVGNPLSWSDEVSVLRSQLPKHERTRHGVLSFFKTLRLDSKGIASIDRVMLKMSGLRELSLKDNAITVVENLPPSVELLSICMNQVAALGGKEDYDQGEEGKQLLRRRSRRSVQALAATHNRICDITYLHKLFPSLVVLNLRFNSLQNLDEVEAALRPQQCLVVLTLQGNPLALLRDYRIKLVCALKSLKHLDGLEVEEWERNIKVSDRHLGLEQQIMSMWSDTLVRKQKSDFLQEDHTPEDLYSYVELSAARKLQKQYRAMRIRRTATLQRYLLRGDRRGELVAIKVSIDWLKLDLPPEPPATTVAPVTKGPPAKKDKKNVVEEPPPPEPPKEAFTIRIVLPSEFKVAHTLPYLEKKALLEYNYQQDFQLPVTPGLRDLFFFKGLRYQIWNKSNAQMETEDGELETPRDSVSSTMERKQTLLARGVVSFRPFFDPSSFKASNGSPTLTHELPLKLAPINISRRRRQQQQQPQQPAKGLEATLRVRVQLNTDFDPATSVQWLF